MDRSFVIDRDATVEIWNQPMRSYKVLKRKTITRSEANGLFGINSHSYAFNREAVSFEYYRTQYAWIDDDPTDGGLTYNGGVEESTKYQEYEYVLELDANNQIIGGEWVGSSKADHFDFLWVPKNRPSLTTSVAGIKYSNILSLFEESIRSRC